jgi:nucleoside-diphosphate-sugar epimerase
MILITGASGFLGQRLVAQALGQGQEVRAFVRGSTMDCENGRTSASCSALHIHQGDITDPATFGRALRGVEAVIHAAATTSETAPDEAASRRTNVEGTRNLLAACREAGVSRWIQISSLSANPANSSVYGRSKFAADEEVRRSGLRWTILQPGTIYGRGSRGLFAKIVRLARALPVVPVLGPGTQLMRPIHVEDAAWAALACLDHETTLGKTYALGGGDVLTFNDFLRGILRAQGKGKPLVHIPLWFCFPAARVLSFFLKNPPVTVDNLVGLRQMTAPDITAAQRDFGFAPRTFAEGLQETFGGGVILGRDREGAAAPNHSLTVAAERSDCSTQMPSV